MHLLGFVSCITNCNQKSLSTNLNLWGFFQIAHALPLPPTNSVKLMGYKVNSLYCRHCGDLELVSSSAKVPNSGNVFQSNICNLFLAWDVAAVRIISVRFIEVSARRELTVSRIFPCFTMVFFTSRELCCCWHNGAAYRHLGSGPGGYIRTCCFSWKKEKEKIEKGWKASLKDQTGSFVAFFSALSMALRKELRVSSV